MEVDHGYIEIFKGLIKEMVACPDEVKTVITQDERGLLLTIDVNPEDRGKIIGKAGETAKALRIVARVVGANHQARISVLING